MATPRTKRPIRPRVLSHTYTHTHIYVPFVYKFSARLGYPGSTDSMGVPRGEGRRKRESETENARGSGYYRQTLIWLRPGLPSNFRALTRPLTRLSVNAPKRRDAHIRRPRFPVVTASSCVSPVTSVTRARTGSCKEVYIKIEDRII